MTVHQFTFSSPKRLIFGPGSICQLPRISQALGGHRILFLTGNTSFKASTAWAELTTAFAGNNARLFFVSVTKEPSPNLVDQIVKDHWDMEATLVIAVGGGSVLDAGKAVSAMMGQKESVETYLEEVGTRTHSGGKLPFIAVPTTSGTGSEATKNAVLSKPGPDGYKKSLRHDNFIPDLALVDPELTLPCPARVTAACGMDALTQLLEAYVSVKASPMTHALCRSGLSGFGPALARVLLEDPLDIEARSCLSYGAYMSGLALANAGLGPVHGFAGVIGAMAPNRHGQVCGTLLAETTRAIITTLQKNDPHHPSLAAYADAAVLLGIASSSLSMSPALSRLIDQLDQWVEDYKMPPLRDCGIKKEDIVTIARKTGQKNTPTMLTLETLISILEQRF